MASLALERMHKTAIKKPKILEPESPGKILAGYQLKIKNPAAQPTTINATIAKTSWLGSP